MIPKKRKERKGEAYCDVCERKAPPIHEYEFRLYDHLAHWLDLCDECGAVDRAVKGGFLAGIHYDRAAPKKSIPRGQTMTPQRAESRKGSRTPPRPSKAVERAPVPLNAKPSQEAAG